MILRRLAHSIRKQDWFSVVIEFVIVVAGIFVALQVTEWHEQRQALERELGYLVRLGEDVAAMRAEIDEILARAGERPEAALRTFRALEQCDAALASPDDFRTTFAFYQNQRTAVLVERTYEEMVASGAFLIEMFRARAGMKHALTESRVKENQERILVASQFGQQAIQMILVSEPECCNAICCTGFWRPRMDTSVHLPGHA